MLHLFGWTVEQIAYAKQRHDKHIGKPLTPTCEAVLTLKKWWEINGWPEPLSVLLVGVNLEDSERTWAAEAVCSTAAASPYMGYEGENT